MRFFAWYAGIATVLFAAFTAWIFALARKEKPGDATLDFAFVGFIAYLWLLVVGIAASVLWRKWIDRAPVSRWLWIPAAVMFFGAILSVARFALDALASARAAKSSAVQRP